MEFSVVVPLIPEHDRYVHSLIQYLSEEDESIAQLIICRSETLENRRARIQKKYERWGKKFGLNAEIVLSSIPERAFDGSNRNRGIGLAKSDFVVFLDADDKYMQGMFKVLERVFLETSCHAILHDYTLNKYEISNGSLNNNFYVNELCLPSESSLLDFEVPIQMKGSNKIPKIHHAHLTINKRVIHERYLDIFPGADTEYCKRIIRTGHHVVYIQESMSFWNRKRSLRYKIRLAKKKFGFEKT